MKENIFELRFEKYIDTDINVRHCQPHALAKLSSMGEQVSAWYGLVDAKLCIQGWSPWPSPSFPDPSKTYICTCLDCILLERKSGPDMHSCFQKEQKHPLNMECWIRMWD
jgi:hypothetical protein